MAVATVLVPWCVARSLPGGIPGGLPLVVVVFALAAWQLGAFAILAGLDSGRWRVRPHFVVTASTLVIALLPTLVLLWTTVWVALIAPSTFANVVTKTEYPGLVFGATLVPYGMYAVYRSVEDAFGSPSDGHQTRWHRLFLAGAIPVGLAVLLIAVASVTGRLPWLRF